MKVTVSPETKALLPWQMAGLAKTPLPSQSLEQKGGKQWWLSGDFWPPAYSAWPTQCLKRLEDANISELGDFR